jgi:hypothetical protein
VSVVLAGYCSGLTVHTVALFLLLRLAASRSYDDYAAVCLQSNNYVIRIRWRGILHTLQNFISFCSLELAVPRIVCMYIYMI